MAGDAKIRLMISSALDASGIKATKAQVDQLAGSISKANRKMSDDAKKAEQAFGEVPGPLGKIGKAFGGVAGQAMLVAGAFKLGWEVGEKLKSVIAEICPSLGKMLTYTSKYKEEQKAVKRAVEENQEALKRGAQLEEANFARRERNAEKAIRAIDAQARAWLRVADTKAALVKAGDDAELQKLARMEFEDTMELEAAGNYDAVEQTKLLYDLKRAEIVAQQKLNAFDAEGVREDGVRLQKTQQIVAAEERLLRLRERADKAYEAWQRAEDYGDGARTLKQHEMNAAARYERYQRRRNEALEAEAPLAAAREELEKYDSGRVEVREQQRATLVESLNLERDRAALAYDRSVATIGNALGIEFDADYIKQLNQSSVESYDQLVRIQSNTMALAAKLDELLKLKD